jgi:cell division protein FtsB
MTDEKTSVQASGKKVSNGTSDQRRRPAIAVDISILVLGAFVGIAIWWVFGQVRQLEVSLQAVHEEQKTIVTEMQALKESARDLKGELDRLAPRAYATPPPLPVITDAGPQ